MGDIKAVCSRRYTAVRDSGTRDVKQIRWIVLHDTEILVPAERIAHSFAQQSAQGSSHLVIDDDDCFRTLANDQVPWAAPGANTKGFHIEQVGKAAWTQAQWLQHDQMLRRTAFKIALHARLFDLPLRWVGVIAMRAGLKGVTTHAVCSKAFGGDHTDPGSNYPKAKVMGYARAYLAELEQADL